LTLNFMRFQTSPVRSCSWRLQCADLLVFPNHIHGDGK
jgi:hypothetical protein